MDKQIVLSHLDFRAFYKSHLPGLKENGKAEAKALCPFHDDKNPSLGVNLETGLYHCFACGARGDVFTFHQKLKGVDFKTALAEIGCTAGIEAGPDNGQGRMIATYEYKDVMGKLLYRKLRIEPGPGERSKTFKFEHLEEDRWVAGRGHEAIPYNLPLLDKSLYAIICEGEGKVETLRQWGLVATSFDSGASSPWRDSYLLYFQDKRVVVLPDNDAPGKQYAQRLAQALYGVAKEIKIVNLPGLRVSEDIIQWAERGGNKDKLRELVRNTTDWTPPQESPGAESTPVNGDNGGKYEPTKLLSAQTILDFEDSLSYLVEDLIPQGGVVMIVGKPGIGKTWLGLLLGKAVSEGIPLFNRRTTKARVVYIDLENPLIVLKGRLKRIRPMQVEFAPGWAMEKPFTLGDKDLDTLAEQGCFIILDSLVRAHGVEENSATEMAKVMGRLRQLANKGGTILFLHHKGKSEENEYRGSSDILAGVDVGYLLDSKDGHLELRILKSRIGAEFTIPLRLNVGHDSASLEDLTQELEVKKRGAEKEKLESLLDVIKELHSKGTPPAQAEIITRAKEVLDWGRNVTLKELKLGEGRCWKEGKNPGGKKTKIYRPLLETEHQFNCLGPIGPVNR